MLNPTTNLVKLALKLFCKSLKKKQMKKYNCKSIYYILVLSLCLSCKSDNLKKDKSHIGSLFSVIPTSTSKLNFRNEIKENISFNFLRYLYIYNGGGVSLGDINNDGLLDVYFTANQGSNKLFLNKGDMVFEDITENAGLSDSKGWSTGTSMVDINNDGLLDIYVCKSASLQDGSLRKNKLFINKGSNRFVDEAPAYGLDANGFSTQAYWFDYDNDGDLDMYLVNHRADFKNTTVMSAEVQANIVPEFSDRFYRNDGQKFTDITQSAGIVNKTWGLSASIYDFNNDGYMDIYVCNDFLEPDHLWINNQKGGFTDEVLTYMDHISYYSMGSDIADINNDGMMDLIVVDMVSEDHKRSKQNMPGMSTQQFNTMVDFGYHHQYMANMLQLNRGKGNYSEISHLAGVSKTDWSWAPLFVDFDNDGWRDLYITNGIKRDMTDNDYKKELKQKSVVGEMTLDDVFAIAPSFKMKNYGYRNKGNTSFENKTVEWGFDQNLHSNGAAYGDLDNDGDLDLVLNNLDDFASLYENHSINNTVKLALDGPDNNRFGIGTKVCIHIGNEKQHYQHFLNRGFQSSVGHSIVFGLGESDMIDKIEIMWPDGKYQVLNDQKANKLINISYENAQQTTPKVEQVKGVFAEKNPKEFQLNYQHKENVYDDFSAEILLPYKYSSLGPGLASADVNGDGLMDVFIGGAEGMKGQLLVQGSGNKFTSTNENLFDNDKNYEDINALFFDADSDGDLDLYVVSGGNEKSRDVSLFQDRLYINNGKGEFSKAKNKLPNITQSGDAVVAEDYDGDGDLDLFVGGRIVPGKYPTPASSMLLENNQGKFKDVSNSIAPDLKDIGLVTDAIFSDYDEDGDKDILVVGEWMPLVIMENKNNQFSKKNNEDVSGVGWWYHINAFDINGDGKEDYVLGNLGLNNKFGAKEDKPFHVFCDDFDNTGNLDIVLSKESKDGKLLPVRGRECSSQQMPFIKEKFPTFKSFAEADLQLIYGKEKLTDALHYSATNFETVLLINKGNGNLELQKLPIEAQYGPTLKTIFADVNKDGKIDIVGAGNIYDAEVETVRFDGSKGYTLLGDGAGKFKSLSQSGLMLKGDVKDMEMLKINGKDHLLVAKNKGGLQLFEIQGSGD